MTSSARPATTSRHASQAAHGTGPALRGRSQLSPMARSRAVVVLPTPRGPARGSHGTREGLRTVAPFRAWRGWQIPVAWGPAFIAAPRGSVQHEGTSGGSSTPLERIAGTGHRYLPV